MTGENKQPSPNREGEILIREVQKALSGLLGVTGSISDAEKATLENMNSLTTKAQVIVNKDGSGATVISSNGNITKLGNAKIDIHDADTENNMLYMYKQVAKSLENDGAISNAEKKGLIELDEILKDVSIVVTDDQKSVIISDDKGHHEKVSITSPGIKPPKEMSRVKK